MPAMENAFDKLWPSTLAPGLMPRDMCWSWFMAGWFACERQPLAEVDRAKFEKLRSMREEEEARGMNAIEEDREDAFQEHERAQQEMRAAEAMTPTPKTQPACIYRWSYQDDERSVWGEFVRLQEFEGLRSRFVASEQARQRAETALRNIGEDDGVPTSVRLEALAALAPDATRVDGDGWPMPDTKEAP